MRDNLISITHLVRVITKIWNQVARICSFCVSSLLYITLIPEYLKPRHDLMITIEA